MKAAMRQIEEIKRLKEAIAKTDSKYLKRDYRKNIRRLEEDLKEYCSYRGFEYGKIMGVI